MLYQISNGAVAFGDDVILHSIDFEIRNTEKIQKAESWYDELLTGANAISLPSYLAPDGVDFATIEISLPSHQIDAFCAVNDITVNSFMHAAFAIFVKRLIKEENPLYLTISNGRDIGAELQPCVGMFVKTLPIRTIHHRFCKRGTQATPEKL